MKSPKVSIVGPSQEAEIEAAVHFSTAREQQLFRWGYLRALKVHGLTARRKDKVVWAPRRAPGKDGEGS